jgi:transposase
MRKPRLSEGEKLKVLFFRQEMHLTEAQIAKKVNCSQQTVSYIIQQHKHRIDSSTTQKHGQKNKLSPKQFSHLKHIIKTNKNMTSSELQSHLSQHDSINISSRSVRRYRRSHFHPAHELLIPHLTLQHHLERMDYCLTHATSTFHNFCFSDEKHFVLDHTSSTVWLKKGEARPVREISSLRTSVMVWGGIWYHGRTELAIVEGNINAQKYISILRDYLLPSIPTSPHFLFQHDNARPHSPISVHHFLFSNAVNLLDHYPANSPDFNPIEHVWSWMVHDVNKQRPSNRASLINAVQLSWQSLSQAVIQAYIDNLPAQLAKVERAGGARLN